MLNLLFATPAPRAWLFVDPGAIGAFSACWACCVARRLSERAPQGWFLGVQPGVTLARLDPAILLWAVGVAETSGAIGSAGGPLELGKAADNATRRLRPASCTCPPAVDSGRRRKPDLTVLSFRGAY